MITVLNAIPYGKENAVSKQKIMELTGFCDKKIRKTVKELNKELVKHGEAILSSSRTRGYWRSTDIKEMKEYIRESKRRQQTLSQNDVPIQYLIYKTEGVKMVPVRAHFRNLEKKEEITSQIVFQED